MSAIGNHSTIFSRPVCSEFTPIMLNGQKCYQLDLGKKEEKINFQMGVENSLTLVLDYNEDKSMTEISQNNEAMIYVDTLGKSS